MKFNLFFLIEDVLSEDTWLDPSFCSESLKCFIDESVFLTTLFKTSMLFRCRPLPVRLMVKLILWKGIWLYIGCLNVTRLRNKFIIERF